MKSELVPRGGMHKNAAMLQRRGTQGAAFRQEDKREERGVTVTLSTCSPWEVTESAGGCCEHRLSIKI